MMYQRIFVPVDSSLPANMALTEAIRLAKGLNATLLLAHSVDIPAYGRGNPELLDSAELEKPLLETGRAILKTAGNSARDSGVAWEEILLENRGDPISQVLLDAASAARADVIVMGTHGRSGIMHLLLGSVAEGVLRRSEIPVLLVRGEA